MEGMGPDPPDNPDTLKQAKVVDASQKDNPVINVDDAALGPVDNVVENGSIFKSKRQKLSPSYGPSALGVASSVPTVTEASGSNVAAVMQAYDPAVNQLGCDISDANNPADMVDIDAAADDPPAVNPVNPNVQVNGGAVIDAAASVPALNSDADIPDVNIPAAVVDAVAVIAADVDDPPAVNPVAVNPNVLVNGGAVIDAAAAVPALNPDADIPDANIPAAVVDAPVVIAAAVDDPPAVNPVAVNPNVLVNGGALIDAAAAVPALNPAVDADIPDANIPAVLAAAVDDPPALNPVNPNVLVNGGAVIDPAVDVPPVNPEPDNPVALAAADVAPPINPPPAVRCAKHRRQRTACPATCIFRQYFPADMDAEFESVNNVFGSQCIEKLLRRAPTPAQRALVPAAIIDAARAWQADPAQGTFGEAQILQNEIIVLRQLVEDLQAQVVADNPNILVDGAAVIDPAVDVPPVNPEADNAVALVAADVAPPINPPPVVRCAKHRRHKSACPASCIFRPYFPANMDVEFESVNDVFGSQCIEKLLRRAPTPAQRALVPAAIIDAARAWQADPAQGTFGEAQILQNEVNVLRQLVEDLQAQVLQFQA